MVQQNSIPLLINFFILITCPLDMYYYGKGKLDVDHCCGVFLQERIPAMSLLSLEAAVKSVY